MSDLLDQLERVRGRRVIDQEETGDWFYAHHPDDDKSLTFDGGILLWIDEYTTGRFYADMQTLKFEKAEDATIFSIGFGNPQKRL